MDRKPHLIALLYGPDQPGIVARVSGWIFQRGGNILHADQHRDDVEGIFFQRVEWIPGEGDADGERAAFRGLVEGELGMRAAISRSDERPRVVLFVSRIDHCFHDILLRWKAREFSAEIVGVVSNHARLRAATEGYGLPFFHVPVTKESKPEAEARQLAVVRELDADLIVLARYMQILSARLIEEIGCPVINIHHSFLPAFVGAKPYHQAHERGVKIIGATAHYVTADLDAGPIIQQAVAHVNHRHSIDDLVRKGRDLEKLVLAQAVRWHLEHRVLSYGNKTVVFD